MIKADMTACVLYGGCDRTEGQIQDLFTEAGFHLTRVLPVEETMHFLEAVPA